VKHRSCRTGIASGYVDDRARPERLRFPRFATQRREMLAFAHIPTGNHSNNKEGFIIFDFEGRGRAQRGERAGQGGRILFHSPRLAIERAAARAVPDQKVGPVFFAKG
jgi:hypothetical protein